MNKDTDKLPRSILKKSREITDQAGRKTSAIKDGDLLDIAEQHGVKPREVYITALSANICPRRYLRNRQSISIEEQLTLARSSVTVVGAGGLGGQIIILLARMGIGLLKIIDDDIFDETNLNRQALSTIDNLGQPKAEAARKQVEALNPAVETIIRQTKLTSSNAYEILSGSDVVMDALDNINDRLILEETAKSLGAPLVHGAVAGFEGQFMSVRPKDSGLKQLFGDKEIKSDAKPELILGTPAVTVSIVAALEVMEAVKILLNRGKTSENILTYINVENAQFNRFSFDK